jgi:hypothetical protein
MNPLKPGNYCYAFSGLALSLGLSMAFALCTTKSGAQPAPGAGPEQAQPPAAAGGSGVDTGDGGEAKVRVKSISISGNKALSTVELQQLVAGMVGSRHSLDQLNTAARRITAYYRERGFTAARAYLAQQDISNGAISILVAEGRAAPAGEARDEPRPGERGLMLLHLLRSQR